jgi:hypothetical protein
LFQENLNQKALTEICQAALNVINNNGWVYEYKQRHLPTSLAYSRITVACYTCCIVLSFNWDLKLLFSARAHTSRSIALRR